MPDNSENSYRQLDEFKGTQIPSLDYAERDVNYLSVSEDAKRIAAIILRSYDSLTEEQRSEL